MPESTPLTKEQREALYRARLREAWNRASHPGWLSHTWDKPGNYRMRVYLALILRGVDWGNPNWPLLEEQRLFYEPRGKYREAFNEPPDDAGDTRKEDRSNPWHDGLAGGICGLALALGAAISLGWIHL